MREEIIKKAMSHALKMDAGSKDDVAEAIRQIRTADLEYCLHPHIIGGSIRSIGIGYGASPGAAAGPALFDIEKIDPNVADGLRPVVLCHNAHAPDLEKIKSAAGIAIVDGGKTCHTALVCRGINKSCVVGLRELEINAERNLATIDAVQIREGDIVTIDGSSGEIFLGKAELTEESLSDEFIEFVQLCSKYADLDVRVNAEEPSELQKSLSFSGTGVGVCRTEHMFLKETQRDLLWQLIISNNNNNIDNLIDNLKNQQIADFIDIFSVMSRHPVAVRLLDPPLHEFLPAGEAETSRMAKTTGMDLKAAAAAVRSRREKNPMLGHRGCRLGLTNPEIYIAQVIAAFEALEAIGESEPPALEILIPFIESPAEMSVIGGFLRDAAKGLDLIAEPVIGAMIETPAAALNAGEIVKSGASFLSFGTNDLTQTTLAISRDDGTSFFPEYFNRSIFTSDPFVSLDKTVLELIRTGISRARNANPEIEIGICGEHAADPHSILSLSYAEEEKRPTYLSCSPMRIPIAYHAAALATFNPNDKEIQR